MTMEDETVFEPLKSEVEEDTQIISEYEDEIYEELHDSEINVSDEKSGEVDELTTSASKKVKSSGETSTVRKPLSKWLLFTMANREPIRKANPTFSFKEIANALADKYRNLTAEESE